MFVKKKQIPGFKNNLDMIMVLCFDMFAMLLLFFSFMYIFER